MCRFRLFSIVSEFKNGVERKYFINKTGEKVSVTDQDLVIRSAPDASPAERERAFEATVAHLQTLRPNRFARRSLIFGLLMLAVGGLLFWLNRHWRGRQHV